MRRWIGWLLLTLLLLTSGTTAAQGRICNPFTTVPDAGMLVIGSQVQFTYYLATGPAVLNGVVEAYYIQSCWPGIPIFGMDPQAYVVNYFSPDGARVVLNRGQIQTR